MFVICCGCGSFIPVFFKNMLEVENTLEVTKMVGSDRECSPDYVTHCWSRDKKRHPDWDVRIVKL